MQIQLYNQVEEGLNGTSHSRWYSLVHMWATYADAPLWGDVVPGACYGAGPGNFVVGKLEHQWASCRGKFPGINVYETWAFPNIGT
jgi:hypothetical protein